MYNMVIYADNTSISHHEEYRVYFIQCLECVQFDIHRL